MLGRRELDNNVSHGDSPWLRDWPGPQRPFGRARQGPTAVRCTRLCFKVHPLTPVEALLGGGCTEQDGEPALPIAAGPRPAQPRLSERRRPRNRSLPAARPLFHGSRWRLRLSRRLCSIIPCLPLPSHEPPRAPSTVSPEPRLGPLPQSVPGAPEAALAFQRGPWGWAGAVSAPGSLASAAPICRDPSARLLGGHTRDRRVFRHPLPREPLSPNAECGPRFSNALTEGFQRG